MNDRLLTATLIAKRPCRGSMLGRWPQERDTTPAPPEFDRDGVDLRIQSGGAMRPALELQLKATVNLIASPDGHYRFPLKRRNYDLLRMETQTPRLLVVLDLPREEKRWITIAANKLVLRRRAYWLSLRGCEPTDNRASVTVHIPKGNVFDVDNLRTLMDQARRGAIG